MFDPFILTVALAIGLGIFIGDLLNLGVKFALAYFMARRYTKQQDSLRSDLLVDYTESSPPTIN